ncbi:MAG: hypothetical protein AB8G05_18755 [Oligoflexales bacterium]
MKNKRIIFFLIISLFSACGPEKTIDNRESSTGANSPSQEEGKDLDFADFSDAHSEEFFNKKFQIILDWDNQPKAGSTENNRFQLSLKDIHGNPIKISYFDFRLYMKIHGHGGLDKNRLVEMESDNQFICSNFFFTMPGPWELKLRIAIGNEKFAFDFPINVTDG